MDFNTFLAQRDSFSTAQKNNQKEKASKPAVKKKIKAKSRDQGDIFQIENEKKNLDLILEERFPEFFNFQDKPIKDKEEEYIEKWQNLMQEIKIDKLVRLRGKTGLKKFFQNFLNDFLKSLSLLDYHFYKPMINISEKAEKAKAETVQRLRNKIKLVTALSMALALSIAVGRYFPKTADLITNTADNLIMAPFCGNISPNGRQPKIKITTTAQSAYILAHKDELIDKAKNKIKIIKVNPDDLRGRVAGAYEKDKLQIFPQQLGSRKNNFKSLNTNFWEIIKYRAQKVFSDLAKKQKDLSSRLDNKSLGIIK